MIQQLHTQTQASIRQICHVLQLPRSSFYHAAKDAPTRLEDRRLGALIEEIFKRNRRRYGYRRIAQELKDHDIVCAPARLRRLMRQSGLRAIQPKNYLPKTSDGRAEPRETKGSSESAFSSPSRGASKTCDSSLMTSGPLFTKI